jgi:glutamate 5-kinase
VTGKAVTGKAVTGTAGTGTAGTGTAGTGKAVTGATPPARQDIAAADRIVVKVGSSSLTTAAGEIADDKITALAAALAARRAAGQIVLVSSGAIASGLVPLGLTRRPSDLATQQAAASVGQGLLIARYTAAFSRHGIRTGQVLLSADDLMRRTHYRNAQRTLDRLLELGVLPVVNENDTVATEEIRFGDNDRLAALVAHVTRARALVLLSDVDGLYDGDPRRGAAQRIAQVRGPADLEGIQLGRGLKADQGGQRGQQGQQGQQGQRGQQGQQGQRGQRGQEGQRGQRTQRGGGAAGSGIGGMATKVEAAMIASAAGIPTVVADAASAPAALAGDPVGTYFPAHGRRPATRLLWLRHAAVARGSLRLDKGAVEAVVARHASLLPAGITGVEGTFDAGDPVNLRDEDDAIVARGLVNYDAAEIPGLMGRSTRWLASKLGPEYEREVVHRDDLVIL